MGDSQTLAIGGMTCAACVARVEKVLRRVPGVTRADVNLMTARARVEAAPGVAAEALIAAVEKAGYSASTLAAPAPPEPAWPVVVAALLTLPLLAPMAAEPFGVMVMLPGWAQLVPAALVQLWLGVPITRSGWKAARGGAASMDTLVALGTWAAFLLSLYLLAAGRGHGLYFESSALVLTLVRLGRLLEGRARLQTGAAIRALAKLRPETARVRRAEGDAKVPAASLAQGDLVVVLPGARVPVDGTVVEGVGSSDESHLTGESLPVAKVPGSRVLAGAINGAALLLVRAQAVGEETVLARMARLVEDAQAVKPAVQKLADRISAVFVPAVLGVAAVTLFGWLAAGLDAEGAILRSVAVLVIACPCALGLATPAAIMAGTGLAAGHGILIRDPAVLAEARHIHTVVFDKTGTLTQGRPALVRHLPAPGETAEEVLRIAAALQAGSAHPLAKAVLAACPGAAPAGAIRDLPGRGVAGEADGRAVALGSAALLDESHIAHGPLAAEGAAEMAEGRTVSWLIETTPTPRLLGLLAFADPMKPEAAAAIATLRARGMRTMLLSGDNPASVASAARAAGIDEAEGGVLPAGKAARVAALRRDLRGVAMVGDGINDAAALAEADLGMAMATGTDIAMQTAGITLMRGDLRLVPAALDIAARIQSRVWQGLGWAFLFNAIGIPLAAFGQLSPALAGGAMAFSSLAVVLNALALRWR